MTQGGSLSRLLGSRKVAAKALLHDVAASQMLKRFEQTVATGGKPIPGILKGADASKAKRSL